MHRFGNVLLLTIIAMLLVVGGLAVNDLLNPPYTDQQIQASLVDTWEAEAWRTMALLIFLAIAAVLSTALTYRSHALPRRLSILSVLVAFLVGALAFSNHAALTNRVTQLTGQTFGSFYGLL